MRKINLHTHTNYCDGVNTPEEMVLSAIDKGFDVLGFSCHSYTSYDESYAMSRENTIKYVDDIAALREKYGDKIKILCGIEQDSYSEMPTSDYDYVIGSVHAFPFRDSDGNIISWPCVDLSLDETKKIARELYNGDYLALAEDYYDHLAGVYDRTKCDIIGHFDLITKFNEKEYLIDVNDPRYVKASEAALNALLKTGAYFEINTGAMAKGYRTSPYPSLEILKKINAGGGKVMINSDCHNADKLDYGFEEALKLARQAEFKEIVSVDDDGKFIAVSL